MAIPKVLRISRRSVVSSLFGITFVSSIFTVSASNILPCPARPDRARFADGDEESPVAIVGRNNVTISKKPRRWLEEVHP
ncbi:hypothetical protein AB1N83_000235 [Pleurotus pulmonarius]